MNDKTEFQNHVEPREPVAYPHKPLRMAHSSHSLHKRLEDETECATDALVAGRLKGSERTEANIVIHPLRPSRDSSTE